MSEARRKTIDYTISELSPRHHAPRRSFAELNLTGAQSKSGTSALENEAKSPAKGDISEISSKCAGPEVQTEVKSGTEAPGFKIISDITKDDDVATDTEEASTVSAETCSREASDDDNITEQRPKSRRGPHLAALELQAQLAELRSRVEDSMAVPRFIRIEPEQDYMTIEERYAFYETLDLTECPIHEVTARLGHQIFSLIGNKQWLALWIYKVLDEEAGGRIVEVPCIVRVKHVDEEMRAVCSFITTWEDESDDESYQHREEKELLATQHLAEHDVVLAQLSPVLHTSDMDKLTLMRHHEDLVSIATIIDHVRFWETVIFREWDTSIGHEVIEIDQPFDSELKNRLVLYRQLRDGTMSISQVNTYYECLREYNEISDELTQLTRHSWANPEVDLRDDIMHAELRKIRCAKTLDFWETMEVQPSAWTRPRVLKTKRLRQDAATGAPRHGLHMVTPGPIFTLNMAKMVTAQGLWTDTTHSSVMNRERQEFQHSPSLVAAFQELRCDDIVRLFPGVYEAPKIIEQNCIVQALSPSSISSQTVNEPVAKPLNNDPKEEHDTPTITDDTAKSKQGEDAQSAESAPQEKHEDVIDIETDAVILGPFEICADYAILENLQFRLEEHQHIAITGGNTMLKNCELLADNISLVVHPKAKLTIIDCNIIARQIVKHIGANVEIDNSNVECPIIMETMPVYEPEISGCIFDSQPYDCPVYHNMLGTYIPQEYMATEANEHLDPQEEELQRETTTEVDRIAKGDTEAAPEESTEQPRRMSAGENTEAQHKVEPGAGEGVAIATPIAT